MRFRDMLEFVWAGWRAEKQKARLVITTIAISLGVVMLLLSLGYGLNDASIGRLARHGALTTIDVSRQDADEAPISDKTIKRLQKLKYIKSVIATINYPGLIQYGKKASEMNIIAAPQGYLDTEAILLLRGKLKFSAADAKEIIISHKTMEHLGVKKAKEIVGKTVKIAAYLPQYQDTGGFKTAVPSKDMKKEVVEVKVIGVTSESEFAVSYIPKDLVKPEQRYYTVVRINAEKQANVASINRELQGMGYETMTYGDKMSDAQTIKMIFMSFLAGSAFFVLLIVGVLGAQTMSISLLERAKEVKLMKKIGMSEKMVQRLYKIEALSLITMGCSIGIIGAYAFGWLCNLMMFIISKIFGGAYVGIFAMPVTFIPIAIFASVIIGFIAGFVPARRIGRMPLIKGGNGTGK